MEWQCVLSSPQWSFSSDGGGSTTRLLIVGEGEDREVGAICLSFHSGAFICSSLFLVLSLSCDQKQPMGMVRFLALGMRAPLLPHRKRRKAGEKSAARTVACP